IADWWTKPMHGRPMWRDMMARIEGPVVSDVAGILAENWMECCGEILTGPETYKPHRQAGSVAAFAIKSSPADRATTSRALFQTLIEGSNERIVIATPTSSPNRPSARRSAAPSIAAS